MSFLISRSIYATEKWTIRLSGFSPKNRWNIWAKALIINIIITVL